MLAPDRPLAARRFLRRLASVIALVSLGGALLSAACGDSGTGGGGGTSSSSGEACPLHPDPDPAFDDAPPLETPRWAFEPWISKDISDGPDTYAFVQGFHDHAIPVGAVVLDSPWETNYNTLVPNPTRYPNFGQMVSDMHAMNVRVVLWTTAFVNSSSFDLEIGGDVYAGPAPGHDDGVTCGYFVDGGNDYGWWKGLGASIDFFNPEARAWWHRQQDPLFDMGVDGFKLDFGDTYVTSDPVMTAAGPVPHQSYSEDYYHDFYAYGRARRGSDFLTMVRAYDASYGYAGRFFARKADAPVTWMGDNRRDDIGLADALDEMFRSSRAGYAVVGSDIGGYLDRDDIDLTKQIPLDPDVFARWTAVGALNPFMQLHGRANLTPWTVPQNADEITNLYRYFATLHHELVPFFYSLTAETYAGGPTPLQPIGDETSWPNDYRYMLGDAFLVAPLLDGSGKRDVVLPAGAKFYDFFAPTADALTGGQTLAGYAPPATARIALFVRSGAIIPLEIGEDTTGLGSSASAGKTTYLIYPDTAESSFTVHDDDGATTVVKAKAPSGPFTIDLSRATRDTIVRVRADAAASISVGGTPVTALASASAFDGASSGYFVDAATRTVWIHVPASTGAVQIVST